MSYARSIWLEHDAKTLAVTGAVIGVSSHLLYWMHGLRAPQSAQIFWFHVTAFALTTALSIYSHGVVDGITVAGALNGSYLAGVFTSISIYRVFFHRLSRFPGPFPAKVSKLYSTWKARHLNAHNDVMAMHEKYGDIVRSGMASQFPFGRLHSPHTDHLFRTYGSDGSLRRGSTEGHGCQLALHQAGHGRIRDIRPPWRIQLGSDPRQRRSPRSAADMGSRAEQPRYSSISTQKPAPCY